VFLRFIPQPTSLENMRLPILLVLAAACIAAEAKTLAQFNGIVACAPITVGAAAAQTAASQTRQPRT
jgi:hypothetical protein